MLMLFKVYEHFALLGRLALVIDKSEPKNLQFFYSLQIRVELGLDRCSLIYTGAAPISLETLRYFQSINLPLLELYGMSECTGVATLSYPRACKSTAVGKVILGVDVKIFNQDEDGSGEVSYPNIYH